MKLSECTKCSRHVARTQVVRGKGSGESRIMFVGEAPGRAEDVQGKPFVGPAGKKLSRILRKLDLRRGDVYITNVVKCARRDSGQNVSPTRDEIDKC